MHQMMLNTQTDTNILCQDPVSSSSYNFLYMLLL